MVLEKSGGMIMEKSKNCVHQSRNKDYWTLGPTKNDSENFTMVTSQLYDDISNYNKINRYNVLHNKEVKDMCKCN